MLPTFCFNLLFVAFATSAWTAPRTRYVVASIPSSICRLPIVTVSTDCTAVYRVLEPQASALHHKLQCLYRRPVSYAVLPRYPIPKPMRELKHLCFLLRRRASNAHMQDRVSRKISLCHLSSIGRRHFARDCYSLSTTSQSSSPNLSVRH